MSQLKGRRLLPAGWALWEKHCMKFGNTALFVKISLNYYPGIVHVSVFIANFLTISSLKYTNNTSKSEVILTTV